MTIIAIPFDKRLSGEIIDIISFVTSVYRIYNMDNISPKYQMDLVEKIDRVIWEIFPSYQKVEFYIMKWHMEDRDWNNPWENFYIVKRR